VGDVNGDGHADLAVANSSGTVSVLMGNGSGGFAPAVNFAVGSGPPSVAVGDFNGDGHADLAVTNGGDNTVSVLIGDGSGNFGTEPPIPVGTQPLSVAVRDFNGDGHADLAVANFADNTVSVLVSDGTGNFGTEPPIPVGTGPRSVAVGDFNGDGRADLAVANSGDDTVSVLLNTTPVPSVFQFDAASYSVDEGAGTETVTVTRTGGTTGSATVQFATSNGTAIAGTDYTATTQALTFEPGQTSQTVTIPIIDDNQFEPVGQTVNLSLSNPSGGTLGSPATAVLNIVDNEVPSVFQLGAASSLVSELAGTATLTVTRTGGTAGGVSVQFATSNGTAIAGTDYTAVAQALTFGPGQTSQTVTIPIINNGIVESLYQTVNLTLRNPIGGTLGSPATGVLTIKDAEPRITATGNTLTADNNHKFTGAVASFTSADFNQATDFTAIINWGDGTQTAGSIVFNQTTGKWDVVGTHKYSKKGTFAVQITITDPNGFTAVANSTMNA
jgi:hypothetical protein